MSYLDVIPLAEAKTYLRIDDTQNETDAEITLMIKAALSLIEKRTNHIFFKRDKEYIVDNNCVLVYDYPINTLVSPTDATRYDKGLYSIYGTTAETITLNVGYDVPDDIPSELVEAAKMLLKFYYFEQEKADLGVKMPMIVQEIINTNRRFII